MRALEHAGQLLHEFRRRIISDEIRGQTFSDKARAGRLRNDQVHRTHLGSLNGFLAEVKRSDEVIGT